MRQKICYGGVLLAIVGVMFLLSTCGKQYALLLTIKAQRTNYRVKLFDLLVKELDSGDTVLRRLGEQIDTDNPYRDISADGQALKVAVEFAHEGNYLVYIQGRSASGSEVGQFAILNYQVDGVISKDITLSMLVGDMDKDGFPACGTSEIQCPPNSCNYLDCDDTDPQVHPFGNEICENKKDDDCSAGCSAAPGQGDEKCEDNDGDKVPNEQDCDDNDPCRSPKIFEAKNLCDNKVAAWDTEFTKACKDKLAKEGKPFTPPFCGDGIDQNCDGRDVPCFVDKDCDGFSPPEDCKDDDKTINPGAAEKCDDNKDNNCNKVKDEGCVPCDVDGDQYARIGGASSTCKLEDTDPDDYDSGINLGTTKTTDGLEGGHVLGALREVCSTKKEKKGATNRDVDHDGDKIPAKDDGCPTLTCDQDGDGFEGSQCNPPRSELDCDDKDPHTFPGAPDKCNDNKAQNCVSDTPNCDCDKDGDGYCPTVGDKRGDCNDNDKSVHPWALERCDKVDNDCDDLTDEGNPDDKGNLINPITPSCTDSNVGKCKLQKGICACSALSMSTKRNEQDRIRCLGEDHSANASQRCFGAGQPGIEKCDSEDWDCNGNPEPQNGELFHGKGKVCGTNEGTCVAGTVVGCNLKQTVDGNIKAILSSYGEYNEHWVCSTGTIYPKEELCNGKDDDCDKDKNLGWPELDERDKDNDKYMACTGCKINDLATSMKGCGDYCNDNNPQIFPTQQELCDGVDNNCKSGDEGVDQCQGLTCCPSIKSCRNLKTDFYHCNACGSKCPETTTDRCVNGVCVCGTTGGPCTTADSCKNPICTNGNCLTSNKGDGTDCTNGKCFGGNCCTGCVLGTCQPGTQKAACGRGGTSCVPCTSGQRCSNGVCICDNFSCPSGCCSGTTCQEGNTLAYCGTGGGACSPCTTSDDCQDPVCNAGGVCGTRDKVDGTSCSSGSGKCHNGSCCTGCWSWKDFSCLDGNTKANCGTGGEDCISCWGTSSCVIGSCQ